MKRVPKEGTDVKRVPKDAPHVKRAGKVHIRDGTRAVRVGKRGG